MPESFEEIRRRIIERERARQPKATSGHEADVARYCMWTDLSEVRIYGPGETAPEEEE